jgi:hypothetical protein
VVVRKPSYATTEMLKLNLRIEQKAYEGLERLPWEDLALAYFRAPAARRTVARLDGAQEHEP